MSSRGDKTFAVNYCWVKNNEEISVKHQIWSIFDTVGFASDKCPDPQDTFDHRDNLSVLSTFICEKSSEAFAEVIDITFWKWLLSVLDFTVLAPYVHF